MSGPDRDEIDRLLASEDRIAPSSGFASSVMEAVRESAALPPPLPVPWGRLAAGLAACVASAVSGVLLAARLDLSVLAAPAARLAAVAPELGYAAIAVLASLAALLVQRARAVPA
jgi:hypothetical protein